MLLTGRVPAIVEAFRNRATGESFQVFGRSRCAARSRSTRGAMISSARSSKSASASLECGAFRQERQRLDKALKVLANATSYGIFAEMIREEGCREGARHVLRHRSRAVSVPGAES